MRVPKTLVLPVTPRGSVVFTYVTVTRRPGKSGSPCGLIHNTKMVQHSERNAFRSVAQFLNVNHWILSCQAFKEEFELAYFRFHGKRIGAYRRSRPSVPDCNDAFNWVMMWLQFQFRPAGLVPASFQDSQACITKDGHGGCKDRPGRSCDSDSGHRCNGWGQASVPSQALFRRA